MTEITLSGDLTASIATAGLGDIEGDVCITCSDEGRPLEIVGLEPDGVTARALGARGEETVDVSLVGPVAIGEKILVHAGLAITKVED
ncbi:MAG: HypC/HybG/HupF family hydrogenase formation chaperone [Mobiluncus porci]|uniref:HypC/HybG/HupF family hydrogenase formation chaperone n=1 Tax=Mobiluncus TaxID=2050 RepID=UPI0023F0C518|nr:MULTISPECIES: HypC/HybG/HupF family hydrogenase formation chaperone [Mobiluncus]MCI6584200.1 HypC/HybG/HupF family hydrogenase formation chaperone [Mobiluncus sp.]MDD7541886.1 HypC/HybG/HupF family hydrogenase formation chaperone [Mobiluncus porci]MDY5749356.1 HypC/HybG/HupF family hydrogenase formation chaperone [Mobiluncus porci]